MHVDWRVVLVTAVFAMIFRGRIVLALAVLLLPTSMIRIVMLRAIEKGMKR